MTACSALIATFALLIIVVAVALLLLTFGVVVVAVVICCILIGLFVICIRLLQSAGQMANPLAVNGTIVEQDLHDIGKAGLCSASLSLTVVGFDYSWRDHHTFFSFLPDVQHRHGSFQPSAQLEHPGTTLKQLLKSSTIRPPHRNRSLDLKISHLRLNLLDLTPRAVLTMHHFLQHAHGQGMTVSGVVA
ncbi:hypothetical protein Tco_0425311 [Tanacetum coccineum]